ncbi:MAG: hypothetical protein H6735_09980 [Alphaproteobacteria bacterium]|nr:hypothetical protein [Alphaproteobacteria bacterium]
MSDDEEGLSDRQLSLLEGLREAERSGHPIDVRSLARRAGYTESSVRTYFTKRLEGVLVFRDEEGQWRARGALRCSEEEFARRMSQKAGAANDALRTEEAWRAVVRKLLYEGQRRHYHLSREELELVEELTERERGRPRTDEVPIQPTLFKR